MRLLGGFSQDCGPSSFQIIYRTEKVNLDVLGGLSQDCLCGPPTCKFNICKTGIAFFLLSSRRT